MEKEITNNYPTWHENELSLYCTVSSPFPKQGLMSRLSRAHLTLWMNWCGRGAWSGKRCFPDWVNSTLGGSECILLCMYMSYSRSQLWHTTFCAFTNTQFTIHPDNAFHQPFSLWKVVGILLEYISHLCYFGIHEDY